MGKLILTVIFVMTTLLLSCEKESNCKQCNRITEYVDADENNYMATNITSIGCRTDYELLNGSVSYDEYFSYNAGGVDYLIRQKRTYVCK